MNRRFALVPFVEAAEPLAERWRVRAADAPVFLSWEWLVAQAATSGRAADMHILTAQGQPLAMVCRSRTLRHGIMPVRQWWVNETGDPAADRVALEYNGMLALDEAEDAFRWLLGNLPDAEEVVLRNAPLAVTEALCGSAEAMGWGCRPLKATAAPWVDLVALRASGGGFVRQLGSNTRAAVRRAARLYEQAHGALTVRRAETAEEALRFFGKMEVLHTAQWVARGGTGAFADTRFRRFHRHFLADGYRLGQADLLAICAGEYALGYLYNLRSPGGWVMAYQSGFAAVPDNRWKPGYLSHALAIEYYAQCGATKYDFLAGKAHYKVQMADGETPLGSVAAFAPRTKFMIENALRRAKDLAGSRNRAPMANEPNRA